MSINHLSDHFNTLCPTSLLSSPCVVHRLWRPAVDSTQLFGMLLSCLPPQVFSCWLGGVKGHRTWLSTHTSTIQSEFLNPHKCNPKWIYGGWEQDNTFLPFLPLEGLSWEAVIYIVFVKTISQNRKSVMLCGQLNNTSLTGSPFPCPSLLLPRIVQF